MDDLKLGVDFLLNTPEVKQQSQQIRKEIASTDDAAQKAAKHVGETVKNVQTNLTKGISDYAINLSTAKFRMTELNTQIQAQKKAYDSGKISQEAYIKQLARINAEQAQLKNEIALSNRALAQQGKTIERTKPKFNTLGHSINQISRELPAFAVSAQIGILALSNNIPMVADEVARLKAENTALVAQGKKSIPVWKSISGAILSWNTALSLGVTLITIYGKEIGKFFEQLFRGRIKVNEVKESIKNLNSALESSKFTKATQEIFELKNSFDLAKEGVVDKKEVLDLYNGSLGKVIGEAKDLNEAEQLFIENSDSYVRALLYREAALVTAKQTAEKLVEFQQKENELNRDRLTAIKSVGHNAETDVVRQASRQQVQNLRERITNLKKERDAFVKAQNNIFQSFKRKEFSFGLDFTPEDKATGGAATINRRQSLLDQIAAVDREYARKKLDSDEAEIQALKDKFIRIRELVDRFNADPKNKDVEIWTEEIDFVQERAMASLLEKHQKARDEQARKKAEREQKEEDRRTEKIRAEGERAREAHERAWKKQLEDLRNYQKRRLDLIADYEALRAKLVTKGRLAEAEELDRQHIEELDQLDDAQIKKTQAYKELFDTTIKLTKDAAARIIANAKELLVTQEMSVEAKERILKAIAEIEQFISDQDMQNLSLLVEGLQELGDSLSQIDSSGLAELGRAISGLGKMAGDIQAAFSGAATKADAISMAINGTIQMIGLLASSAKARKEAEEQYYRSVIGLQNEYLLGLNEQLRLQSELSQGAFLNDYEGRIRDAQAALAEANGQYQEALNALSGAQVQVGLRDKFDLGNIAKGAASGLFGLGGVIGGIFGKKKEAVFGSLLEEYPELLEQLEDGTTRVNEQLAKSLINHGLLNEESAAMLENVLAWQEAIEQAQEQIKDVISELAGGLGTDLKNTLVEAFKSGEDAAAAMKGTVEDMLESIVSQLIFNKIFAKSFEDLEREMGESFDGGDDSWIDDFGRFFSQAQGLTSDFNAALEAAAAEASGFGLDLFSPEGSGNSLSGSIRRELTEATASELTGLYRATFDLQTRSFELAQQQFETDQRTYTATLDIVASNAAIEQHTANTVQYLTTVVDELKQIRKNTRSTNNPGYGKGLGS